MAASRCTNDELKAWADRVEKWTDLTAGQRWILHGAKRYCTTVKSHRLGAGTYAAAEQQHGHENVAYGDDEGLVGLSEVLWRLQMELEGGQPENYIAKLPDTTRLLSRLLRLDLVLCSEACEPLFACMACLLPSLVETQGLPVGGDAASKRKLTAMRERCGLWCGERMHAAVQGLGDGVGKDGFACGTSTTVDLLYDCGFAHTDMLQSLALEANASLRRSLESSPCFACEGANELLAMSLSMQSSSASSQAHSEDLRCGAECLAEMSRMQWQSNHHRHLEAVRPESVPRGIVASMCPVDESFLQILVDEMLTRLAAEPFATEERVKELVRSACGESTPDLWVSLAFEEALIGAMVTTGRYHSNLAYALMLVRKGRERSNYVDTCRDEFSLDRDEWLWVQWSEEEEGDEVGSPQTGMMANGDWKAAADTMQWARACSLWHGEGSLALLKAFGDPNVGTLCYSASSLVHLHTNTFDFSGRSSSVLDFLGECKMGTSAFPACLLSLC